MPHHSCICTVLLKLAKVEWLKIRKFWTNVLPRVVSCCWLWPSPPRFSPWFIYTLKVKSANFQWSLCQMVIMLFIQGVSSDLYLLICRCINPKHAKILSILLESNGCWNRPLATPNGWHHRSTEEFRLSRVNLERVWLKFLWKHLNSHSPASGYFS